jgi:hypothetical protein
MLNMDRGELRQGELPRINLPRLSEKSLEGISGADVDGPKPRNETTSGCSLSLMVHRFGLYPDFSDSLSTHSGE